MNGSKSGSGTEQMGSNARKGEQITAMCTKGLDAVQKPETACRIRLSCKARMGLVLRVLYAKVSLLYHYPSTHPFIHNLLRLINEPKIEQQLDYAADCTVERREDPHMRTIAGLAPDADAVNIDGTTAADDLG